jgi:hypothetical protein
VDNLPHTNTIDALHSESHIKDSMVSAQQEQRKVKSEHGSPLLSPSSTLDQLNGLLPPLDFSNISGDCNFMQNLDGFSSIPDHEQPMFSAGLSSASIDWSHYDGLDFNNENFAASSYSQAPSFTGFDFSSIDQPALTTTSTSGEISEVEDFGLGDTNGTRPALLTNQYGSDFDNSDFGGDIEGYRLSAASSYIGLPQAQMLASNNVEDLDVDAFLKGIPTTNSGYSVHHGLPTSTYSETTKMMQSSPPFDEAAFQLLSAEDESDSFWMNNFAINTNNNGRNELIEENVWAQ